MREDPYARWSDRSALVPFRAMAPLFRSQGIRVLLDVDRLERAAPDVQVWNERSGHLEASSVFPPWYVDRSGRPSSFENADARPVSYADLVDRPALISPEHAARANALRVEMQASEDYQLLLPAYAAGGIGMLVLDGNHRLLAALLAGLDIGLTCVVVHGPTDPLVLPDLEHWRSRKRSTVD